MQINNIGYHHFHDADFKIERPNGSGDYLLLLFETPAVFILNGKEVAAAPNSFILYKKGTPQFYHADGAKFSNDWIHFDMTCEDLAYLKKLEIPFDKVISLGDMNELSLFVKNMCFERYSDNKYKEDTIQLYMRLFFIKLSEKIHFDRKNSPNSYYEKLSVIRTNIYNMPYSDWNVEGVAHQLTMSKSYFQHLYKEQFGTSIINDVIQSRIDHARYLLSSTDLSVIKIGEMCGYTCTSHFFRQFKLRMKVTPSEYRENLKIVKKS